MGIVHYVVIRRDLPLGTLSAMLVHAAGESGALYADWIGGAAVVLGVDTQDDLRRLWRELSIRDIPHVAVQENGALYAVGLVPIERGAVSEMMKDYPLLSSLIPLDKSMGSE